MKIFIKVEHSYDDDDENDDDDDFDDEDDLDYDDDDDDHDGHDLAGDAAGVGERQGFDGEKEGATIGAGS